MKQQIQQSCEHLAKIPYDACMKRLRDDDQLAIVRELVDESSSADAALMLLDMLQDVGGRSGVEVAHQLMRHNDPAVRRAARTRLNSGLITYLTALGQSLKVPNMIACEQIEVLNALKGRHHFANLNLKEFVASGAAKSEEVAALAEEVQAVPHPAPFAQAVPHPAHFHLPLPPLIPEPPTSEEMERVARGRERAAQLKEAVNKPDARGLTPLHRACIEGRADLVDAMLQAGANPAAYQPQTLMNPIHFVRDRQVMEILIKRGASLGATDKDGNTVYHYAWYWLESAQTPAEQKQAKELIDYLEDGSQHITASLYSDSKNRSGQTPRTFAKDQHFSDEYRRQQAQKDPLEEIQRHLEDFQNCNRHGVRRGPDGISLSGDY